MKHRTTPDQNRRRKTARRISYHHPETDLDYVIRREAQLLDRQQADLDFLNTAFNLH